jgi:hypothetical protein
MSAPLPYNQGMKWLREVIRAHYWPDPLLSVLCDLMIGLTILLGVLLIRYEAAHHGHLPF